MFYLCRPFLGDEDVIEDWTHNEYWWYRYAHVCQRWRNVILGSATYLGLSLVCTYATPVADMLAHSPPLPLIVGYFTKHRKLTAEHEEGIIIALAQRNRVRRVRLGNPATIIQNLIAAMDEEFPILEYLCITLLTEDNSSILRFPETFQAPLLRHLDLRGFALPIASRLLTTSMGLVTLHLDMVDPSTYFYPNTLLQWISHMPQLETLIIYFQFSIPNRDVERQLTHTPIIAPITLPNLHNFGFRGISTYLEALVHQIAAPRLEKLTIEFFNQLTFSCPRLLQFIDVAGNLRFGSAVLTFSNELVGAALYPLGVPVEETKLYGLGIVVKCYHLDWQVSSIAQISDSLGQIFSGVELLVLQQNVHSRSPEEHNEVDRTECRKLLRPFSNVKTLRIQNRLIKDFSRFLELEDGELPLQLLPKLHRLEHYSSWENLGPIRTLIDARQNAGRPVTSVRL